MEEIKKILYDNEFSLTYKDNREKHYEKNIENDIYYDIYDKVILKKLRGNNILLIYYHNDYSKYKNNIKEFINDYLIYEVNNLDMGRYLLRYMDYDNLNVVPLCILKVDEEDIERSMNYLLEQDYKHFDILPSYIVEHYISRYNNECIDEYENVNNSSGYIIDIISECSTIYDVSDTEEEYIYS